MSIHRTVMEIMKIASMKKAGPDTQWVSTYSHRLVKAVIPTVTRMGPGEEMVVRMATAMKVGVKNLVAQKGISSREEYASSRFRRVSSMIAGQSSSLGALPALK